MATASKRHITPAEYLAIERQAETKSEYLRGEMFALSGGRFEHTRVKDNVAREAGNQLKGGPCQELTSDMRVRVDATSFYTYPDVVIVCDQPEFEDEVRDTLLNPRAVVEVLSESTEKHDRGAKFGHYRQVASLQEYVLIAQDRPLVERFVRQVDGSWLLTVFDDLSRDFEFHSVGVRIPMSEIYRGVSFSQPAG